MFREEFITGVRLRSRRPQTSPSRTADYIEKMIFEVRNAISFDPELMVNIVNVGLNVKGRGKEHISKTID